MEAPAFVKSNKIMKLACTSGWSRPPPLAPHHMCSKISGVYRFFQNLAGQGDMEARSLG